MVIFLVFFSKPEHIQNEVAIQGEADQLIYWRNNTPFVTKQMIAIQNKKDVPLIILDLN